MEKYEMLIPLKRDDGIAIDLNGFLSLLNSHKLIKTEDNRIVYKKKKVEFELKIDDKIENEHIIFDLTLSHKNIDQKFRELIRVIRKTLGGFVGKNIQVIWDGASLDFCTKLYPVIYIVENTMRKLLSKFMLTNLGVGWHKESVPESVKSTIRKKGGNTISLLYYIDFIQLSNFLFTTYSIKDFRQLPLVLEELIKEKENIEIDIKAINDYIPKNNWDRYFSDILEIKSDELVRNWEELYEKRCVIAHNGMISEEEYKKTIDLCNTIKEVLEKAIEKIEEIKIPDEEKEQVSLETIAINEPKIKEFKDDYFRLNKSLYDFTVESELKSIDLTANPYNFSSTILSSAENGLFTISDPLKNTLLNYENAKDGILSGTIFDSNGIVDFDNKILGNIDGLLIGDTLNDKFKFNDDGTLSFNIDKDNDEKKE